MTDDTELDDFPYGGADEELNHEAEHYAPRSAEETNFYAQSRIREKARLDAALLTDEQLKAATTHPAVDKIHREEAQRELKRRIAAKEAKAKHEREAKEKAEREAKAKTEKAAAAVKAKRKYEDAREPFTGAIKKPLPDGLVALQFEFSVPQNEDDDEHWSKLQAAERVYKSIGHGYADDGKVYAAVITTPELVHEYFEHEGKLDVRRFLVSGADKVTAKRLDTLAELGEGGLPHFKGVSEHDYHGRAGGFEEWLARATVGEGELSLLAMLAANNGGHAPTMLRELERIKGVPPVASWLVPGMIPRGVVTILVGEMEHGKSTMISELGVAVGRKLSEWMGFPIEVGDGGYAIHLIGEDTPGFPETRIKCLTPDLTDEQRQGLPIRNHYHDGSTLAEVLEGLEHTKVNFLSIDTARTYVQGEDSKTSWPVTEFLDTIIPFAREKNCAVLVTLHPTKSAEIRSLADVEANYAGSKQYVARARSNIAIFRNKKTGETRLRVFKHNSVGVAMFETEQRLRFDKETQRHFRVEDGQPEAAPNILDAVRAALDRLLAEGVRVTRTGRGDGLYELCRVDKRHRRENELKDFGRNAIQEAVKDLLAAGEFVTLDDGSLAVPDDSGNERE
jgi:AAA domain-containing protein